MERKPAQLLPQDVPSRFHPFLKDAAVYDSSCSNRARVWFLDRGDGFYLKTAPKGTLSQESAMNAFFHKKGMGPEVLVYESLEQDWMLTCRVRGEDCTWQPYLDDPQRLCDLTGQLLRQLHETDFAGCPIPDRTAIYLATAEENYRTGNYNKAHFPDNWGYASAEDAWAVLSENSKYLRSDTLLHGDYCLPNIMLDNWQFSGFIDLDHAGVGDRHLDLFWGMWSLAFNLKTDRYRDRFLDAYGRDRINPELFSVIAAAEVFG